MAWPCAGSKETVNEPWPHREGPGGHRSPREQTPRGQRHPGGRCAHGAGRPAKPLSAQLSVSSEPRDSAPTQRVESCRLTPPVGCHPLTCLPPGLGQLTGTRSSPWYLCGVCRAVRFHERHTSPERAGQKQGVTSMPRHESAWPTRTGSLPRSTPSAAAS